MDVRVQSDFDSPFAHLDKYSWRVGRVVPMIHSAVWTTSRASEVRLVVS